MGSAVESSRRRRARFRDFLRAEKERAGECDVCGLPYDPERPMDHHWDHTDPATKIRTQWPKNLLTFFSMFGWAKGKAELAKCRLLCVPCHKWKTKFDRIEARRRAT